MTGEEFKGLKRRTEDELVKPLKARLEKMRGRLADHERALRRHQRFALWCQRLTHGEVTHGWDCYHVMFVGSYYAEARPQDRVPLLTAVDLVIVPEVLQPHDLWVHTPIPVEVNGVTQSSVLIDAPGIVERLLVHVNHAANVTVGTLADVMHETCPDCSQPAMVAMMDKHVNEEAQGIDARFTLFRLCTTCMLATQIARSDDAALYRTQ